MVGIVLCSVSLLLAGESRGLLIGESGGAELSQHVCQLASTDPAVCRVGRPLTMQLGPNEVLLNLELEFRSDLSMQQLCAAIDRIESKIRDAHPQLTRLFLEAVSLKHSVGSNQTSVAAP